MASLKSRNACSGRRKVCKLLHVSRRPSRGRRDGSIRLEPASRALASHVVIHRELVRMRAEPQGVVFFLFHVDPVRDEVGVEDVAAQKEGMIGLKRFDRAAQRIGHARRPARVLPAEVRRGFVERIARIDAVLDSIETGEQQRGECDVRIG